MTKHWLYYISPCILASVICLLGIIAGFAGLHSSGGWSFIAVLMFAPALPVLLIADWLVKTFTKGRVLYIWIIELILIVIGMFFFPQYRAGVC